uniref:Uncharacterized protein n=1 Tax=uncultured prokaryote TaxID=198431 RepID=A0A0H5Q579_9ZZZZ|nr:hypothetical protein [uncultured prokaryote]
MPTAKPRLSLTLEPVLAAQLSRLSQLTGNSQSKIITEILEGSTEVFARLIQMLEAAQAATAEVKGKVGRDLKAAQTRMERQLGLMLDDMNESSAPLLEPVETVKRRARKGAQVNDALASAPSVGLVTPPSNRGVRSIKDTQRKAKNGPV